jgi:phytoene desaturase
MADDVSSLRRRVSRPAPASRIVIVGAGLGGLSAACHLAGRGHDVTVVERDDLPGGRAGTWTEGGYRFDTGPSVLTMHGVLSQTFAAAGADLEDHLQLHRLDPAYRASYADGSEIRVRADRDAMAAEIAMIAGPTEAVGFHRFVDWVTELYRVEFPTFIERDLRSPLDLAASPLNLARLVQLHGFGKLQSRVEEFFADDRLRRLFSFQALYAGLSPLRALAIYAVISYMDCVEGVWFPDGGMHAIATGLAEAATKAGVEFRYGTTVERITAGHPCLVHTSTGTLTADAVVVNPDLPVAYEQLTTVTPRRRVRHGHYSPSCIVWMMGVQHAVQTPAAGSTVEHHNIHFGDAWGDAFDDLLRRGRPMADPSRLVTVASISDPTAAPVGGHTLFVLEPVPNRQLAPSMSMSTTELTDRMMTWARQQGYVQSTPQVSKVIDPEEWERLGMGAGTPFALDHRFSQSGPFRPGLTDRRLPGVVFVGSSTRPGVGVPMVLISGGLAADAVEDHLAH